MSGDGLNIGGNRTAAGTDEPFVAGPLARGDQAVIDVATAAAGPHLLEPGTTYAVAVPAGGSVRIVDRDLDDYRTRPRRIRGTATVHDADSFIAYLGKHAVLETEIYAHVRNQHVVAVINAHQGNGSDPAEGVTAENTDAGAGWADHRLQLVLHTTNAWQAWVRLDRKLLTQIDFAEHVEDRLVDIVEPSAADLLEVVQTFTAHRKVSFESSQRLSTGTVQLQFREEEETKAGRRGQLAFPEQITLGLVPYEGGAAFRVKARLRYRITDGALRIGFVLDRPEDVLRTAFLDDVARIDELVPAPLFRGVPA